MCVVSCFSRFRAGRVTEQFPEVLEDLFPFSRYGHRVYPADVTFAIEQVELLAVGGDFIGVEVALGFHLEGADGFFGAGEEAPLAGVGFVEGGVGEEPLRGVVFGVNGDGQQADVRKGGDLLLDLAHFGGEAGADEGAASEDEVHDPGFAGEVAAEEGGAGFGEEGKFGELSSVGQEFGFDGRVTASGCSEN